jgi:hypothetical protein
MSEIEEMPIRQFKLMNGDEIIGLVANNNETNFVVDRPFKVEANENKADMYRLVPWFDLSLSNTFTIDKSMVVAHAAVAGNIKETYVKFAISLDEKVNDIDDLDIEDFEDDNTPDLIPDKNKTYH